ncbi:Maf family protein [Stenotrophobium rhamnosiphilum]|uniref:dTTP/UTP pyrophosphatase n=1 Tax=Stenotrophobium rhamnosiphilum TaxID=2029166 RepID=A0A2T5MJ87_9GAMM|nr:nucleoside triphosphate pyrophosphatase [Stenotrophobium rhamnosiphilum]PTU32632.1 septum formation protein Maf [Stenotrophobium rhamnosiphilum]
MPDIQFHLASASPRRQELLQQLGLHFDVRSADIVEQPMSSETAADYARRMALEKALATQARIGSSLPVLGADTDVVLDGHILGKPRDRADALAMLAALSNREHEVYSAVAMVQGSRAEVMLSVTHVSFGVITPEAAALYWDSGEPADKAGAYGIQGLGAQFVKGINGSYSGVVGLPLFETTELLLRFGIHTL